MSDRPYSYRLAPEADRRQAKRYNYRVKGSLAFDGESDISCVLQDISLSGIQIEIPGTLAVGEIVQLAWNDSEVGELHATMEIVREKVHSEMEVYYGLRFVDSTTETKTRVAEILDYLENRKYVAKEVDQDKLSLETIYEFLDEGAEGLYKVLKNPEKYSPTFCLSAEELKSYEKRAFDMEDGPFCKVIQQLSLHFFTSKVLSRISGFALLKVEWWPEFISQVAKLVSDTEKSFQNETEVMEYLSEIDPTNASRSKYIESVNRVFFARLTIAERVIHNFNKKELSDHARSNFDFVFENYKNSKKLISDQPNFLDDENRYERKKKSPAKSKQLPEFFVPDMHPTRKLGVWLFLFLIVGVFVAGYGFDRYFFYQDQKAITESITLDIPIAKALRENGQLRLYFEKDDWKTLDENKKQAIRKVIMQYLQKQQFLKSAVLRFTTGEDLMVVFGP